MCPPPGLFTARQFIRSKISAIPTPTADFADSASDERMRNSGQDRVWWAPTSNSEMNVNRATARLLAAMTTSACTTPDLQPQPVPITARSDIAGAEVVRRSIPEAPQLPDASVRESATDSSTPLTGVVVPANTQYVCVVEKGGVREQTSIEFSAKVAGLCRKHPEMGPCKYERDVCRRGNGRVYAANGVEITRQTEAEYDKKVMRVVFKAN